jgi:hypothetical protein
MQSAKREMWFCPSCTYKEAPSKYRQSQTRFCPVCFKEKRIQIPMRKRALNGGTNRL